MKSLFRVNVASAEAGITDRAFIRRIAGSILGILLSLLSLTSATWTWYCGSVSSSGNVLQSATCAVTVSVSDEDGYIVAWNTDGAYRCAFEANKRYTITLTASGTAESSYCYLVIDQKAYYTQQIPTQGENSISFEVTFTKDTNVEIVPCWGTYSAEELTFYKKEVYVDLVKVPDGVKVSDGE